MRMRLAVVVAALAVVAGAGLWAFVPRAESARNVSWEYKLQTVYVGGNLVDFSLPRERLLAALEASRGREFYAEGPIYRAGEANKAGATPVGKWRGEGHIVLDTSVDPWVEHILNEVWSINGWGQVIAQGIDSFFVPWPGSMVQMGVVAGTGRFGTVERLYDRIAVDPDGIFPNGDEYVRGIFKVAD